MPTNFSPLSDPTSFARAVPERVTYFRGLPRNYRFNAKTASLHYEDQRAITATGATFSLIPLAFRIFRAPLFGGPLRDWAELFFLNQSGHLCVVSFHSSSVDRLRRCLSRELLYEQLSLTDCILTVRPLARNHPQHGPYYVADFLVEPLPDAARARLAAIRAALPAIYRADTVTDPATIALSEAYGYPSVADSEEVTPQIKSGASA